jgi:hypothetical protein
VNAVGVLTGRDAAEVLEHHAGLNAADERLGDGHGVTGAEPPLGLGEGDEAAELLLHDHGRGLALVHGDLDVDLGLEGQDAGQRLPQKTQQIGRHRLELLAHIGVGRALIEGRDPRGHSRRQRREQQIVLGAKALEERRRGDAELVGEQIGRGVGPLLHEVGPGCRQDGFVGDLLRAGHGGFRTSVIS